ncbi:MAG: hypothetical protein GEV09_05555 [Pseudonocardiaceae bacterium]|nr:hypothetical protein [Pseudonocardiaceae bacterium]
MVPDTESALPEPAPAARIVEQRQLPNGATESTVQMGPIIAQPHSDHGSGEHSNGTHTTVAGPVMPPCANCYVTSIKPDLTYSHGSSANYDTGVMLHHSVLFDRSKEDVTCGDSRTFYELTGRRLFASGNERTGGKLPDGYGVKLGQAPMTWAVVELMNMKPEPQTVFLEATIRHVPASTPGMEEVTPVWLDAANCTGDSQHSVPAGTSTTTWRWQSTLSGTVKAAGGHLHDGGQSLALSNASIGQHMCTSEAGYGTDPAYMGHIESMRLCTGQNLGTVRKGELLQLDSVYRMDHAADDVMTIMMAYINEQD